MKVFINNQLFDSEKDVMVLILSNEEKKQIGKMSDEDSNYCTAPDITSKTELENALKTAKQAVSLFTHNTGK